MGDELGKKQRTADVLDCILGKKDPSVLKKKKKPVVSIDDSDGIEELDVKPSKRILHTVREHPPKKIKNPYTTNYTEKSGSGKIIDDTISEPSNSDGRRFLDHGDTMVPNSVHNPKMIVPRNYCPTNNFHKNKYLYHPSNKNAAQYREQKKLEINKEDENNNNVMPKDTIQKLKQEWMKLTSNPPKEIPFDSDVLDEDKIDNWILNLKGPRGSPFYGDKFRLKFKFSFKYPQEAPEVSFIGKPIPKHPQVKTENGRVSIPTLEKDYKSTLSIRTICLSIISMLATAEEEDWKSFE